MAGPAKTNFFHSAGSDEAKVEQSEKDDPAEVAREGNRRAGARTRRPRRCDVNQSV
jgi:hypothetical protein